MALSLKATGALWQICFLTNAFLFQFAKTEAKLLIEMICLNFNYSLCDVIWFNEIIYSRIFTIIYWNEGFDLYFINPLANAEVTHLIYLI